MTGLTIIYEDKNFLVLNKPAGVSVHGGINVKGETVADRLIEKYPEIRKVGDNPKERPGIVHRLDKDTSGVMVAARNQRTFEDLKQLFKERKVAKKYLALVFSSPGKKSGIIDAPIGRLIKNPLKRGVGVKIRGARNAITKYKVLERLGGYSLLEVEPKTGRMHQIRVHLASIGCPVAGDKTYGGKRAVLEGLNRQFLHAYSLEFSLAAGQRWHFEAALPEDLDAVLKRLRSLRKQKIYDKTI